MTNRRNENYDDTDDLVMNDDFDFLDTDLPEDEELETRKAKGFNMDMRHRIEDRMEAKRLKQELDEYAYFDLDDEDVIH